jgi:uncharacterized membrane protein
MKVVRPPTAIEIWQANRRNETKAAQARASYPQEEAKQAANTAQAGNQLTPAVIVALVRFAFYTVFGVSISAALFCYCHLDFWPSFFIGFVVGTLGFLLGWIFWGLCLAGVLAMFGAVHFAAGVLLLIVLGIAFKVVTAGIKGAVIEAIRESKKGIGT